MSTAFKFDLLSQVTEGDISDISLLTRPSICFQSGHLIAFGEYNFVLKSYMGYKYSRPYCDYKGVLYFIELSLDLSLSDLEFIFLRSSDTVFLNKFGESYIDSTTFRIWLDSEKSKSNFKVA